MLDIVADFALGQGLENYCRILATLSAARHKSRHARAYKSSRFIDEYWRIILPVKPVFSHRSLATRHRGPLRARPQESSSSPMASLSFATLAPR